jgi:AcrR family transcriptional regulator
MVAVMAAKRVTRATPKKGWKDVVVAAMATGATVSEAASAAGVSRVTIYRYLQSDAEFKAAFDDAEEQGTDVIEAEATRRAVHGVDEPVIYQGTPTLIGYDSADKPCDTKDPRCVRCEFFTIRKPSDTLAIFLLKGRRPQKFRERFELTGKDGGPIKTEEKKVHSIDDLHSALAEYVGNGSGRCTPQNDN